MAQSEPLNLEAAMETIAEKLYRLDAKVDQLLAK